MAHGLNTVIKSEIECNNKPRNIPPELGGPPPQRQQETPKMGSRRIFTPQFKLQVLESYRNDTDCKGNQRATARKYGIHRRQIQKWLQVEDNLRSVVANSANHHHHSHQQQHSKINMFNNNNSEMKLPLDAARHRVVVGSGAVGVIKSTHSALTTARVSTATSTVKLGKSFISPARTYACDQAVSFTQSLYEYESTPSVSLSALPNSTHTATLVPTNTALIYDRKCSNGGLSHHLPSPPSYPRTIQTSPTSGFTPYQPPTEPNLPSYIPLYEYHHHHPAQYYPTPAPIVAIPPIPVPETPIDLSLPSYRRTESRTPSPYDAKWVNHNQDHHPQEHLVPIPSDAVDLRKRKHGADDEDEAISCSSPLLQPPPKLFKPYLLDQESNHVAVKKNFDSTDDVHEHRQRDAIIWNNHQGPYDLLAYPVSSPPYEVPSPTTTTTTTSYWIPQSSPVSGYDSSTSSIYSDSESTPHFTIDFKVHPIEPCFQERFPQRYVERWLKQEHVMA